METSMNRNTMNQNGMNQTMPIIISVISAMAIGTLIGASIALLVAPQSGKKTRKILRNKSMEIMDMAATSAADARDSAAKALENVSSQAKGMNPFMRSRTKSMKNFIDEQACRVEAKMH